MITKEVESLLQNPFGFSLFSLETLKNNLPSRITDVFDSIEGDGNGNLHFIKQGKGEKIQILFRCNPIGVLLGAQKDDKFSIQLLGKKKEKELKHQRVYHQTKEIGALRINEKSEVYFEKIGKIEEEINGVYKVENQVFCKADKLYGLELSSVYPLVLLDFIANKVKDGEKHICFTLWNESLSKEVGGIATCKSYGATKIIVFSNIKSSDQHPISQGPFVVLKDGCYVASKETRDLIKSNSSLQIFVGKTDNFLEQLSIRCHKAQLCGIYLPIQQDKSYAETMDCNDIKKAGELLLKNFLHF